ncbi:hypothetical protein NQZ68_032553 [Dissostichus eleginoides]|nr:hypothetical protein NQZ68_032553 [Dissostichus eleginoides]
MCHNLCAFHRSIQPTSVQREYPDRLSTTSPCTSYISHETAYSIESVRGPVRGGVEQCSLLECVSTEALEEL